jgi:hypothetical protein
MKEQGYSIQERDKSFVSAYFSKIFSSELSSENQAYMTNEEKFDNLEKLYKYSKNRELAPSLVSSLLHEILLLTFKIENYRVDLFKEYIKRPMEKTDALARKEVAKK